MPRMYTKSQIRSILGLAKKTNRRIKTNKTKIKNLESDNVKLNKALGQQLKFLRQFKKPKTNKVYTKKEAQKKYGVFVGSFDFAQKR